MALPIRSAGKRRGSEAGLRLGMAFSALLHMGLAALVVVASLDRERAPEPSEAPPAFAMVFEGGAPNRPAQREANPEASESQAPPPTPPIETTEPPVPEAARVLVEEPAPTAPVPSPEAARMAEADLPQPADLAVPPPAAPPAPQREAALLAPPRPIRPPLPDPLPGLLLPEARNLRPAPPRPAGPRPGLDLSPGQWSQTGRDSPEPELLVRGGQVGTDWRNAFRRWWEQNGRYPPNAALLNEGGSPRVELVIAPDGRVRSARLVRRSGSVWLDAGAVANFQGATVPALPPGADPSGITVTYTINYISR